MAANAQHYLRCHPHRLSLPLLDDPSRRGANPRFSVRPRENQRLHGVRKIHHQARPLRGRCFRGLRGGGHPAGFPLHHPLVRLVPVARALDGRDLAHRDQLARCGSHDALPDDLHPPHLNHRILGPLLARIHHQKPHPDSHTPRGEIARPVDFLHALRPQRCAFLLPARGVADRPLAPLPPPLGHPRVLPPRRAAAATSTAACRLPLEPHRHDLCDACASVRHLPDLHDHRSLHGSSLLLLLQLHLLPLLLRQHPRRRPP
mmetsp:Transcript_11653/g.23497  ORF Transcript_11653/g.23497 Transcript_11653/m.23497 type:complete len:260 (-) Transcript_11653:650-1429(-)